MFETLFFNVLSVFLMMIPGFLVIRKNIIQEKSLKDFSQVIVKVLYPCLIFSSITSNFTLKGVIESWQLPVSIFVFFVFSYLIGLAYTGFFKSDDIKRRKSILFQFTVNNFSFLPLAIISKLYDEQYMAALIFSTLGAELTVWTIGIFIFSAKGRGFKLTSLKNLLSPPLISIYFSLFALWLLDLFNLNMESITKGSVVIDYMYNTIQQIGLATIPMALVMVGGRMGKIKFGDLMTRDIWSVTLFRLLILPFAGIILIQQVFPNHQFLDVMLIVAIMPNAVISMVFGELYDADQKLMSGTVLITHLLALITIPLWLQYLI